ncbi:MAG: hypothetical protein IIV45_08050 [Lachnospiraceae bacterium]|nr:hypothetical protein [Lachnospiraceae bacterium]
MNRIIAQIEIPEMEELEKAIDTHRELTQRLEENVREIRAIYLQINLKLKENQ